MICFFVTRPHRYTIDGFIGGWARSLGRRISVATYDSLPARTTLRAHSFVFTDLERLNATQRDRAERLAQRIERVGGRVLNRPARVLRRFDLLRRLHDAGRNPFNAYRVVGAEPPEACRFPVFVREEHEHTGALTDQLHDRAQLLAALARLRAGAHRTTDLLVVEFCDTRAAADGSFRKYAAMRIGERIVPRHVLISHDWVDKYPDIVDEAAAREENEFLDHFPHAADVRAAFDLAGIDYGRIDYSCAADGRVVTWEINTNPLIVPPPNECSRTRLAAQSSSARQIAEALAALDGLDVRVSLSGFPAIGAAGRPRDWVALKSMALCHAPLARRAVRAVRQVLASARSTN